MKISEKLQGWELEKGVYLINIANKINMELNEYTYIDVNNLGYVYLWNENYNFSLYMPINCKLQKSDVYALYTNINHGEETIIDLSNINDVNELELYFENLQNN